MAQGNGVQCPNLLEQNYSRATAAAEGCSFLIWLQIFTSGCTSSQSDSVTLILWLLTVAVLLTEAPAYMKLIDIKDLSFCKYLFCHIDANMMEWKPFTQT